MVPNQFSYTIHKDRDPTTHAEAVQQAIIHCEANIRYSKSIELLSLQGMHLPSKEFYNVTCSGTIRIQDDIVQDFIRQLNRVAFHV
jgi:hypothetical protein